MKKYIGLEVKCLRICNHGLLKTVVFLCNEKVVKNTTKREMRQYIMKIKIRASSAGTEYWDNVEKRTRLVPTGSKPDFEVTENPTTMVAGLDITTGKDMTIDKAKAEETEAHSEMVVTQTDITLDEMNVEQLREFAKQNNINLPFNVKKEETIRKNIEDALNASDEE